MSGSSSPDVYIDTTPDGSIDAPGEYEVYSYQLTAGQSYELYVGGASTERGTLHNPEVFVFDQNVNLIVHQNDDGPHADQTGHDELVVFDATYTGTYYFAVGGVASDHASSTGSYQLDLSPI